MVRVLTEPELVAVKDAPILAKGQKVVRRGETC